MGCLSLGESWSRRQALGQRVGLAGNSCVRWNPVVHGGPGDGEQWDSTACHRRGEEERAVKVMAGRVGCVVSVRAECLCPFPERHGVGEGAVWAAAHRQPQAVHPDPVLTPRQQRQRALGGPLHEGHLPVPGASGDRARRAEKGPGSV